jgi:hypothetical protein
VIEFLCPKGHRIRCAEELAGRTARCPKCGIKFRIPDAASANASPLAGASSDVSLPQLTNSAIGPPLPEEGSGSGRDLQIEFLCPHGHRLHGSATLQGKAGQCPECGARFRIPSYEEVSQSEAVEGGIALGRTDGHPLASVFSKLWGEKPSGATVELHLSDGQTLVPQRYAEPLSRQSHGVFAVAEPAGTHTLTVVAWDSVVRVEVRGVESLPKEMSE